MTRVPRVAVAAGLVSSLLVGCSAGEGRVTTTWHVDPDSPAPTPAANLVHVVVTDSQCAGGRSAEDRVAAKPAVRYQDDAISITFTARTARGPQTCPGHGLARRTVRLNRPIGLSKLYDLAMERYPTDVAPFP
jgi:hypothetical protein